MNNMILVKTLVPNIACSNGHSVIEAQYAALNKADSILSGIQFLSEYDMAETFSQTALTTRNGNKVQACRASDFQDFTDEMDMPVILVFDSYLDSSVMEEYNVDWGSVVDNEIRKAKSEDSKMDEFQVWFVAGYVEL